MSSFGRITNSLWSVASEATLTLANFNFDFSIIKVEAPTEFRALGEKLSNLRRNDAEDGQTHKTARRLGALFAAVVPPTPELVKAYGLRASEISQSPKINPRGTRNDGPFEAFIGADGTSIWAAATSGELTAGAHAPLAMHLLACMLARPWDADKATSIWVELVETRQNEISSKLDDESQHIQALMAARQEITREQLAIWDASARSWLRSADEANASKNTQLMLIVKNISLPVSEGSSTYESVIFAWRHAMIGMENLVKGAYQEVSEGSILYALSAWHIYPDLIVLGSSTQNVTFADPLVRKGGALTIGLQFSSQERSTGMQWSLTLSHLLYYGDAVKVDANNDSTRVTMNELLLVALGAMFSCWQIKRNEEKAIASYLSCLWTFLSSSDDTSRRVEFDKKSFKWLRVLVKAANIFLEPSYLDSETCDLLVNRGRRRGKKFISADERSDHPLWCLFGLGNSTVHQMLNAPDQHEGVIRFYRELALQMGLEQGDALIRHSYRRQNVDYYEYATAIPHFRSTQKRDSEGKLRTETVHCRWLLADTRFYNMQTEYQLYEGERHNRCNCLHCDANCPCEGRVGVCHSECHPSSECRRCQQYGITSHHRNFKIQQLSEDCRYLNTRDLTNLSSHKEALDGESDVSAQSPGTTFTWHLPPPLYRCPLPDMMLPTNCLSLDTNRIPCTCLDSYGHNSSAYQPITFMIVHGEVDGFGLFVRMRPESPTCLRGRTPKEISNLVHNAEQARCSTDKATECFRNGKTNKALLIKYLRLTLPPNNAINSGLQTLPDFEFRTLHQRYALPVGLVKALTCLDVASEIYKGLEGSTLSLRVTDLPLRASKWFKSFWERGAVSSRDDSPISLAPVNPIFEPNLDPPTPLEYSVNSIQRPAESSQNSNGVTRAETLACIAMFESGAIDVDPEDLIQVIALASANSLFVASELLSDPVDLYSNRAHIRRVVGNIGRPGMSFLVIPQRQPRIRPLSNNLRVVPYLDYDFKREDNYASTSLHLSFTRWRQSLNHESRGAMDEGAYLLEAFVSVHDRGLWVADLDVLAMEYETQKDLGNKCTCGDGRDHSTLTSLDQWEELLDPPDNVGIVRAHGNWVARLAATAIRYQQGEGDRTFVAPKGNETCINCLPARYLRKYRSEVGVIID